MSSLKDRVSDEVDDVRESKPFLDHLIRTVQHYGEVKGSLQAGAMTYFAFLSFFPVLALSFAVVGGAARVFPDIQDTLVEAISRVLPGILGEGEGQISLQTIQDAAPGIASVGLLVVLYSGLGWISAMRQALLVVFERSREDYPNFVIGKLRDLAALVSLGLILLLSVAVSGVATTLSREILDGLGLGDELRPVVWVIALAVGLGASTVLFYSFFRLLGATDAPPRSLWTGALLGAVGFEALKQLSRFLLASTAEQPAFQAFGIALILLVWINYFSRVVVYAAAFVHTSPAARARREAEAAEEVASFTPEPVLVPAPRVDDQPGNGMYFAAGAGSMLTLLLLLKGRKKPPARRG